LPTFIRFADLVQAGITANWPHLLRMISKEGFPTGVMLSRNVRAWDLALVRAWLASRPTDPKIVNAEKMRETRRRNAETRRRKAEVEGVGNNL
jgi:predicted DNA-binding transcriptional regulator AlpA